MSETLTYSNLTDELLHKIVRQILCVGSPRPIILFGSHARGTARAVSDLDLLIVEESLLPRYKRAARYLRELIDLHPEKDVVVWTPEEVVAWSQVPYSFITTAMREGRILYARQ
jgi:uncharacterized protein